MTIRHKDIAGHRFGRWLVISRAGTNKFRQALWRCICDCGAIRDGVEARSLISGKSRSCGCLQREAVRTHGLTGDRTYHAWKRMLDRCENPTATRFENWGGRGIEVCVRWHVYADFLADMGEMPAGDHSIERIDNDAGYAPGNCVWIKKDRQARNRRTTRWVEVNGLRLSLAEHAERAGVKYKWAWEQIVKRRRTPESIFNIRP